MDRSLKQILIVGSGILLWSLGVVSSVRAEVNVNINLAPPPPVVVEAPPQMVFLPEPGIYVAVGIPFDVYFVSSRYYYVHGGNWFWAKGYGGPWTHAVYKSLPPGLRKYKVEQLHKFREREYKVYKVQGPKFKGKHFVAVAGPGPVAKEHRKARAEAHGHGMHAKD
jgi:hypothetical protein